MVAVLGPLGVGLSLTMFGGWQYKAGIEAGALVLGGTAGIGIVIAMLRGRTVPVQPGRFSPDLNKRHWLWVPIFVAVGIGCLYTSGAYIGDWLVPADRIPVVITFTSHSWRSGADTVHSDHGAFSTPWLVEIDPDPEPGPATLVVGHFSRALLRVESAAP